ncbi:MAG: bifunctional methylenetetrahydrofolate dehydrogenase/methenyltetrahydrofolate cyclohydrolase FolD [Clostridiaceae bacterium]|jgi:methylenetetrahydrofolate dehydrogenase (NADP+)/methenyltetrahydrofolate cyclohydrolase|nr:bifunctional methylenetetrahydrofolate dehydrogenase/methenyltetrahydrofolate cyclohydrolase FolD [Clostridiaceae bacterium]
MSANIISGKEISAKIRERIKYEIDEIMSANSDNPNFIRPGLAVILVGEDPGSAIYVRNKKRICEEVGIRSFGYVLDATTSEADLLDLIDQLNHDDRVHGILCQMPLPKHLDEFAVISAISPVKDVDGFHPINKGLLSMGKECLVPCTPLGCVEMLKLSGIDISGKHCVIIGRSNIVGKPLSALMLNENATVTITHSKTKNLKEICRQADILVAAIGKSGFVTGEFVKEGAVVIDVGINRDPDNKVRGDVLFEEVVEIAGSITPVPGGVGLMTTTLLMQNTLQAYHNIISKEADL